MTMVCIAVAILVFRLNTANGTYASGFFWAVLGNEEEEALHVRKRQSLVRISHDDRIRVGHADCVGDANCVTITICDYRRHTCL